MDLPTEVSLRRTESAQPMKTKTTLMKERFSRWTDSHHERVLTSDSGPYAATRFAMAVARHTYFSHIALLGVQSRLQQRAVTRQFRDRETSPPRGGPGPQFGTQSGYLQVVTRSTPGCSDYSLVYRPDPRNRVSVCTNVHRICTLHRAVSVLDI